MAKDDLNNMLKKIEQNKVVSNIDFVDSNKQTSITKSETSNQVTLANDFPVQKAGFFTQMRANKLKEQKVLEAAEVVFDTQLEKLKHQATAAKRESQAFWDAKSVEVAESIKTYVQSSLNELVNRRLTSKNDAIQLAYTQTSAKMNEINLDETLPDIFKERLIEELMENLKITVERLKNDAIAQKYDLV